LLLILHLRIRSNTRISYALRNCNAGNSPMMKFILIQRRDVVRFQVEICFMRDGSTRSQGDASFFLVTQAYVFNSFTVIARHRGHRSQIYQEETILFLSRVRGNITCASNHPNTWLRPSLFNGEILNTDRWTIVLHP